MSTILLDRRALLVAGVSTIALSACSGIVGPPEAPPLYVLRPPVPPAGGGPRVGWQLSIMLPSAPDSLDTTRIVLQHPDATLDYYARTICCRPTFVTARRSTKPPTPRRVWWC